MSAAVKAEFEFGTAFALRPRLTPEAFGDRVLIGPICAALISIPQQRQTFEDVALSHAITQRSSL